MARGVGQVSIIANDPVTQTALPALQLVPKAGEELIYWRLL